LAVARILVVDNYDSFVYNLVQYVGQLGAEPLVYRNDAITVAEARALDADGLLVSPGPGRPEDAGASEELIRVLAPHIPVLGVCLGHQCIGHVFGGRVVRHAVMHGKTSEVTHDGGGVLAGLDNPFVATRYHSLVVDVVGTVVEVVVDELVVAGVYEPTSTVTVVPCATAVPAAGFWLCTTPFWPWLLTATVVN
jgi:anthranilate synthase/aminodeoxychorismate synthase-like glutamine amidotransferase